MQNVQIVHTFPHNGVRTYQSLSRDPQQDTGVFLYKFKIISSWHNSWPALLHTTSSSTNELTEIALFWSIICSIHSILPSIKGRDMSLIRQLVRPCLAQACRPLMSARCMASDAKLVDVAVNDKTGVATVTMQRPPVNGLNLELLQQLSSTFQQLEDSRCRGMILTSSSSTVFSAGLDIMEMYKPNPDRVKAFWTTLQDVWLGLYGSSFPTVAAINGHSPAGGCLLAMSCEYRVMVGPKFAIGLNETQLGIVAPKWFMDSMLNTISRREAELALTTGRMFSTDEALKVGLIDEVATDKADAIARSEKFLASISRVPPVARKLTKLGVRHNALDWLQQNKELDLSIFMAFVTQPAVQKGLERYLESLKAKQTK